MKVNRSENTFTTAILSVAGQGLCALAVLIALACMPSAAQSHQDKSNHYRQVNLVSDLPGVALLQDTNLVNSWGTSFSGTSPFWISDNGSGLATLYAVTNDSSGLVQVSKIGLQVAIPGDGTPTGSDARGRLHEIDSPWGMALSPITFGKHGDQLLAGNFGSGTIMSFDATGEFRGLLKGVDEGPVVIDGLWALTFGSGARAGTPDTLFFTAGPDGESHGLFGSLAPVSQRENEGDQNDDD